MVERAVSGGGAGILLGVILIASVAALAFLPGLGERDFWPQDEARYGAVSLEMWKGAHPAVPHLNGQIYQDKPPGYFWFVNLAATIRGGVDEWATRLPSAFGGFLIALGAFLMLAPAGGWVPGLAAGLVALATWLLAWEARQARLDVLFGGFIALGMAAFARALEPGRERFTFIGLLMIGLAVLVKGPLALLAVVAFAIAAVVTRRPRAFFNGALLPGLLMVVLPTVLWLGWAYLHLNGVEEGAGVDYLRAMFHQVEGRIDAAPAHLQPWHYYLAQLPAHLLPFFPILLLGLLPAVRRELGPMRPVFAVAACWFLVSFIAQSAFPGKRVTYMVPLVAPFAVICAAVAHSGSRLAAGFASGWATLVACVIFIAGGAMVLGGIDDFAFSEGRAFAETRIAEKLHRHERKNAPQERVDSALAETVVRERMAALDWTAVRRGLMGTGVAAMVLAAVAITALALGAFRAGFAWTAVAVAVPVGLALGLVLPAFDVLISRRPVVEATVAAAGAPDAPLGYLRHIDEAFPYYAGRPVAELFKSEPPANEDEKRQFLKTASEFLDRRGSVLVVRGDDYADLDLGSLAPGRVKGPFRAGSKQFYLLLGSR